MQQLVERARKEKLVIFAGAGVSMPPPSSLPGWNAVNEAILDAFARRIVRITNDEEFSRNITSSLIATRNETHYFSPDYQAQFIEEECGADYFRVLQALDTTDTNACHEAIAALAAQGFVAGIVTTNFDRLLERALNAAGVQPRVFHEHSQFEALPAFLSAGAGDELPVIKVHGSVEAPDSMVDTLRQRVLGRPESLEAGIRWLLARHHVLFLGFSGGDLAYDEGYLGLRAAASSHRGFTCLLYPGTQPRPGMANLKQAWGDAARFIEGKLPDWFDALLVGLDVAIPLHKDFVVPDRMAAVARHADQWAGSLGHLAAVSIMADLLDSSGREELAFELLSRTLRSPAPERDMEASGYARFNYHLGRRLLERGTFDYAIDWIQGRKVAREGNYSPYTANDCFQCLQRGSTDPNFPWGEIDLGLYDVFWGQVAQGLERIHQALELAEQRKNFPAYIDACRTLAIVYELLQLSDLGVQLLGGAYDAARSFGDEPRRARVAAELARFLGLARRLDEAGTLLREGYRIADNLGLASTRVELMAAEGSVLWEAGQYEDALARSLAAAEAFREAGRKPALTRTLIDVGYAAYNAGAWNKLGEAQDELIELIDIYRCYTPVYALMIARFKAADGDVEDARFMIEDAIRTAQSMRIAAIINSAQQLEKYLAQKAVSTDPSTSPIPAP